jgi:RNA polymerase subunit RPABC4/transcription elongation factor Spt4
MTNQLTECKSCKKEVAKTAKICPHCGQKNPTVSGVEAFFGFIGVVVVVAVITLVFGNPDPVNKAEGDIELYYINNKIYYPVDCNSKEVDSDYYVFCTASGGDGTIGGLYLIRYDNEGKYTIFTVNGKASQHAKRGLKVTRLNESKDISEILKNF